MKWVDLRGHFKRRNACEEETARPNAQRKIRALLKLSELHIADISGGAAGEYAISRGFADGAG
jgi:hypothetical protein